MKKNLGVRISENADLALDSMISEITSNEIVINRSKLSSWIIVNFFEKHFQKSKEILLSEHKSPKKQLRNILPTLTHEELELAIKAIEKERKKGESQI